MYIIVKANICRIEGNLSNWKTYCRSNKERVKIDLGES